MDVVEATYTVQQPLDLAEGVCARKNMCLVFVMAVVLMASFFILNMSVVI